MPTRRRVLIVDDDPRMASSLADICNRVGYPVAQAPSGTSALEQLAREDFLCMLTDIHMPGMTGIELFQKARKEHPELPVVLMTAYKNDAIVDEAQAIGPAEILEKPLDLPYLLKLLGLLAQSASVTVIDDNLNFGRSLGAMLQRHGYESRIYDSVQAFLAAEESQPGVLILDLKLKDAFGLDFLPTLKQSHPSLDVILVTGFRGEFEIAIEQVLAEHSNMITCLYKPFSMPELLQVLNKTKEAPSHESRGKTR